MVYHVALAMPNPRPFLLLLLLALSLGMTWSLLGLTSQEEIRITSLNGKVPILGAREPALVMPGPELQWKSGSGAKSKVWSSSQWNESSAINAQSPIHTGSWVWNDSLQPSKLSASSLRNGVVQQADGSFLGWSPDFSVDAEGRPLLVFDRFGNTSFDVVLQSPHDEVETVLASSNRFEAHASAAMDARGRLWVAWDEADAMWGRGAGLHEARELRLVMRDAEGWHQVPLPSIEVLLSENGKEAAPFSGMPELPRLVVDKDGAVWMFYRVMRPFTDPESHSASRRIAWVIRATVLSDDGWCTPVTLPESDGPNHDTLAVLALPEGGVMAAWTADDRLEHFDGLKVWGESVMTESVLHSARLDRASESGLGATIRGLTPWSVLTQQKASISETSKSTSPESEDSNDFVRLWGDLHRHSDLSRCSMDTDGSVPDQYRYAAGSGDLDFVAITDHHQHLTDGAWEFLLDSTDRFQGASDLITLFGFEYAFPDGHRNLICAERSVAVKAPSLPSVGGDLSMIDAKDYIAIPHQITETKSVLDWSTHFQELETQVEIYQRRGSYERRDGLRTPRRAVRRGKFVQDYLQDGIRFGFLASSDHQFSNGAFAVVYAKSRDRDSIMEALRARRSYAATARIDLHVELGELLMGEEGTVAAEAGLKVEVDARAEIARVEVIRNGEIAHTWQGPESESQMREGLLTMRFGQITGRPDLPLHGKGIEFGQAILMDGEPGDASFSPQGEAWSQGILLRYLSKRPQSLGGWVIPARWSVPMEEVEVALGDGDKRPSWNGTELFAGSEWKKSYWGKPVSMRLASQKLGHSQLSGAYHPQDWTQGDWVYVRVIRVDGAMAWSSPIWIDDLE